MKTLYDGYFEQRSLIPAGRLHDIAFEDLERDPLGQIKCIYESLDLPDFGHVEPRLCAYVTRSPTTRRTSLPSCPMACGNGSIKSGGSASTNGAMRRKRVGPIAFDRCFFIAGDAVMMIANC